MKDEKGVSSQQKAETAYEAEGISELAGYGKVA
jgi:hypothetical protein